MKVLKSHNFKVNTEVHTTEKNAWYVNYLNLQSIWLLKNENSVFQEFLCLQVKNFQFILRSQGSTTSRED